MRWFYDLQISIKLLVSFVLVLSLTTLLGAFSVYQLAKVNRASSEIASNWLPSITTALELKVALSRVRAILLQHILATSEKDFVDNEQEIKIQNQTVIIKLADFQPLANSEIEKSIVAELIKEFDAVLAIQSKVLAISRTHKAAEARALHMGEFTPLYFRILNDADKLVSINLNGSNKAGANAQEIFLSSRIMIIGLLAACILLGLMMAIWVSRMVVRPLQQAVHVAQRVAGGDLTVDIQPASKDETGQLMIALQAMNQSLLNIVSQVRNGTNSIATASSQIASGNLDLSTRTEQQASSLQETASSLSALTDTVKQNADNAHQANQLAASASDVAAQGGTVVEQVVDTMESINASSKKISHIIGVIDGIAFQTNILALNAAVEAARAGEQGRGFAVVASEVRNLAQRSASAAKDIKSLIDDSVAKVDTGSKLVAQAGTTMHNIVDSVKRVTDIVSDIADASRTQSNRIEQVNQNIVQMDEVTQQNAALVEQAAAAAQSLQDQAAKLAQVVGVFKLGKLQQQTSTQAMPATGRAPASINASGHASSKPASGTTHGKTPIHKAPAPGKSAGAGQGRIDDQNSWEQF